MDRHRLLALFDKIHLDYKLKDNDYKVFVETLGGKAPTAETFEDVSLVKLIYRKYKYEVPPDIEGELNPGDVVPFGAKHVTSVLCSQIFQLAEEFTGLDSISLCFLESQFAREDFKDLVAHIDDPDNLIRSKKNRLLIFSKTEWIVPLKYEILSRDVQLMPSEVNLNVGRPPNQELRFKIGDRVQCWYSRLDNDQFKWTSGTVDELWYRETEWEPHDYAPYSIKLDSGQMIYAPSDTDEHIRAETIIANEEARLQSSSLATTSAPDRRPGGKKNRRR